MASGLWPAGGLWPLVFCDPVSRNITTATVTLRHFLGRLRAEIDLPIRSQCNPLVLREKKLFETSLYPDRGGSINEGTPKMDGL